MQTTPRPDSTTRAAVESAASTLTLSRSNGTRQASCPFLNSHRDGECAKCLEMAAHDAQVATAASLSPREAKAVEIIETGRVAYCPGDAYVTVVGSHGEQYRVSKTTGCQCADWVNRQPEGGCKHQISARAIIGLYRVCAAAARRGETVRLPLALYIALSNGTALKVERSRTLIEVLAVEPTCRICGVPLVDGRHVGDKCPKCYSATRTPLAAAA